MASNNSFMVTSAEMVSKSLIKATKLSAAYPDAEIRIMLHTGTLSGFDLLASYKKRITKFITLFDEMIKNACKSFFDKDTPKFNRIKIWGAYPALGSYHNLDLPLILNTRTTTLYQKGDGSGESGYSWDYSDDVIEEDE